MTKTTQLKNSIQKTKTFINELQKLQEKCFDELTLDLKLTSEGGDWLFDFIYNTSDEDDYSNNFFHYLETYKKKFEDITFYDTMYNNSVEIFRPTDFGEFSPTLHMSSCEATLGTAFASSYDPIETTSAKLESFTVKNDCKSESK
jgi:hypothetical protein